MINSVQNIKAVEHNPFSDFKRTGEYYITPEIAKDIFETSEKDKERKGKKVGIIIAAASLITALGVFAATKGLPKNTYKWLEKWGQRLEQKVEARKLRGEYGPLTSFYNYSLKTIQKFGEKSKSINNITSFKDMLFMKLMAKTSPTKKIHSKITQVFENLARKSVQKSYNAFDNKFTNLFNFYKDTNRKILARNPEYASVIQNIEQRMQKIQKQTGKGFGKKARVERYLRMQNSVKDLDNRVFDTAINGINKNDGVRQNLMHLKDSQIHQSFIAEELMASDKMAISKDVSRLRKAITHDIGDNYKASEQLINNLSAFIDPRDAQSAKLLKDLKSTLASYKKFSGPYEGKHRELLNSEIIDILKTFSERISNGAGHFSYSDAAVKQVSSHIKEIEKVLKATDKGEFQELLTLYKSVLPRDEYLKLRGKTNKTIKSLDNAINNESNLFFDKIRDLALGSAPTDILTLVGSVAGVGIGLTRADNKDERISATLKYGIPIVGSIATSLYMTIGLVSGGKAMALALLSGWVMNRIGSYVDKHRKHYNKHQQDIKNIEAVKAEISANKT